MIPPEDHTILDEQVSRYAADLSQLFHEHERLSESHAKLEALYNKVLDALDKEKSEAARTLRDAMVQAESARLAKQTFLANMNHELRTPLNAILGMSFIASRRTSDPALLENLATISEAGNRLLRMISEILDTANIEAGHLQIEAVEFSLVKLIEGIEADFRGSTDGKGIVLEIQLDPDLPLRVRGDPVRIGQVLHNLVDNAVKFSVRGPVVLRVKRVKEIAGIADLLFEVEDRGIGISEADQGKIFSLFEQVDPSAVRRFGGNGLGLTVCKLLTGLMGGEIGYYSMFDEGSLFWVALKLSVVGPQARSETSEPPDQEQVQKLLGYLSRLLDAGDYRARRLCIDSGSIIRVALGARSDVLFAAVDEFDFDTAQKIFEDLCAETMEPA